MTKTKVFELIFAIVLGAGLWYCFARPVIEYIAAPDDAYMQGDVVPCVSGEHCYDTPEKCAKINGRFDPETQLCDLR